MDRDALQKQDSLFAERLRSNDELILLQVQKAYEPPLKNWLRTRIGALFSEEDVQECAADTLVALWSARDNLNDSVRNLYFEIGKRKCIDCMRRHSAQKRSPVEMQTPNVHVEPDPIVLDELRELIREGMQALPKRERIAFIHLLALGAEHGWAVKAAEMLKCKAHSVRSLASKARRKMVAFLLRHDVDIRGSEFRGALHQVAISSGVS